LTILRQKMFALLRRLSQRDRSTEGKNTGRGFAESFFKSTWSTGMIISAVESCGKNEVCYRVTRLGEFSPIGRFFSPGSFLKFAQIFGLLISVVQAVC
jgi:hypothetical protein